MGLEHIVVCDKCGAEERIRKQDRGSLVYEPIGPIPPPQGWISLEVLTADFVRAPSIEGYRAMRDAFASTGEVGAVAAQAYDHLMDQTMIPTPDSPPFSIHLILCQDCLGKMGELRSVVRERFGSLGAIERPPTRRAQ